MSYLPFNRGKKPNVWPIIEGSPAGVSMHYIDSGIDSGKIISQSKIDVEIIDTAKTLYDKIWEKHLVDENESSSAAYR